MISNLIFELGNEVYPSYILDCVGNLIFCGPKGNSASLIPFGESVICSLDEAKYPYPWSVKPEDITARVHLVSNSSEKMNPVLTICYPCGKLRTLDYPFAQEGKFKDSDENILKAIDQTANVDGSLADQLFSALSDTGVYKIPAIQKFNPFIHSLANGALISSESKISIVRHGWFSCTKVYQKSLVIPAQ